MGLANDYAVGAMHEQVAFKKEDVLAKMEADKRNRHRSGFYIDGREILLSVCDRGQAFKVSRYKNGDSRNLVSDGKYFVLDQPEAFAELVADYSEEKCQTFAEATDFSLKMFIDTLPKEQKDLMLYDLLVKGIQKIEESGGR